MINAKDEFLKFIEDVGGNGVEAANLEGEKGEKYTLYPNYTNEELKVFLKQLDFSYDHGYGAQYIDGTIFFNDGTWAERLEYDGAECWDHKIKPPLPERKN